MKITFNPSTVAALTTPPNNKDITFDLRGQNIFARGVKFCGTDTNTWRDIKINNVSIGSNILDLRNGSNTTLTNTNGIVTINSTWRPVVDNLTSNSTISSLSANQGRILKTLIDGKSNSDHNHDDRYVKKSGDTMSGVLTIDTTNFGALIIKRNDDTNGASIQFSGKSSVYGYIGLNNSTKDKQFLRWNSDTSKTYTILDTSSTYTSNGKGVINGTTITQVDNATNSTNSTNARKLVNWYSTRPTSLNAQFGDGSLRIFYATSSTTIGKPAEDSHILHLAWDNTDGWDAQLAVHSRSGKVSTRAQNGGTWQPWKTLAFTTDIPSSLKNPYALTISLNGTSQGPYDGSAAKNINITPGSIGAATSGHNHDERYVFSYGGNQMDGASINKNALGMATNSGITGDWWHILQASWSSDYRWNSQIAFPTQNRNGMYYRSGLDDNTAWGAWVKLLDTNNYSSTLDSRYYTESEVNSLLNAKLNRQNLSYGTWNPRGYNLAADYYYNGGDLSISENGGKMYVSINGQFYQNEGQYRVLDTSDIGGILGSISIQQYLSNTDTGWYPLIWGGNDHRNTYASTGAVYKSYDKLSWQTSSQTLYATNIQTNNIKNLSIGGGIYWNPYVESTTDSSDAASITVVKSGVSGGTTLVLSQMDNANNTIQFKTNAAARLYHNNYPILTTQNTYVSNNKGYINGTEITQVNNADTVDGVHVNELCRIYQFSVHDNIIKVGTLTSGQHGRVCKLRFNSGVGYNALNQDKAMTVVIRASNDNANSNGFYFEAHSESYRGGAFTTFYLHQTSNTQCELYMAAFNYSGHSIYEVSFSAGNSWTNEMSIQNALPTSNIFTLPNYQIAYNDYNVASASRLQTPRTIWGQPFDGTANVSGSLYNTGTITAGAAATYDIGSNTLDYRYGYFQWLGSKTGTSLRLAANDSDNQIVLHTNSNVGIGTNTPAYKLDVNGQMRAGGFRHESVNSDNYMLLAGGGYKSFGGDYSTSIFLGYLDLYHGSDGTVSSSFYCLGYSVPFTYTRGGNYCRIYIPDTTRLSFYINAAIASVNYSGGGMDTWVGVHRSAGAWWLHCYASGWNEVRVKGFRQSNENNDSWWGGNPLYSNSDGANRITVCIFGHVNYM